MAVMKGFQRAGLFVFFGGCLLRKTSTSRQMLMVLVFLPVSYTHLDVYKRQVGIEQMGTAAPVHPGLSAGIVSRKIVLGNLDVHARRQIPHEMCIRDR